MGDVGACPCVFTMRRRRYFEKQTNQEAAERPACRHNGCKCNGYGLGGQFCAAKSIAGSNRRRSSVHHGQTRRDHRPSCQSRQQHGNWLRHRRLSSRQKRGALHLPVPFEQSIMRILSLCGLSCMGWQWWSFRGISARKGIPLSWWNGFWPISLRLVDSLWRTLGSNVQAAVNCRWLLVALKSDEQVTIWNLSPRLFPATPSLIFPFAQFGWRYQKISDSPQASKPFFRL